MGLPGYYYCPQCKVRAKHDPTVTTILDKEEGRTSYRGRCPVNSSHPLKYHLVGDSEGWDKYPKYKAPFEI